ncbi:hypothetical protein KGF71_016620 [Lactiplantibacillus plantarum]|uniref:P27 family phage terminase small subunit n=1 Tax=Lactiplantibacillus plantarum TaxID=1590 RepID=UPI001C1F7176|nr:P27 family phage terminase small subunit [Lactiplantibacillus plantarum]MBU7446228.1 hypothetical protein [Lactiplantibacillus plantarum]MBU7459363.1 hypothetical protein [Lactiplantibacillus plantarum]
MAVNLNSRRHEGKVKKMDRQQSKEILQSHSGNLQPEEYLSDQQKIIFNSLVGMVDLKTIPLQQIDTIQLSQLAIELDIIQQANESITDIGILIDNKRNPAIMVRNTALKNISMLLNDMNLTLNKRIHAVIDSVENKNIDDPFKDLMSDD